MSLKILSMLALSALFSHEASASFLFCESKLTKDYALNRFEAAELCDSSYDSMIKEFLGKESVADTKKVLHILVERKRYNLDKKVIQKEGIKPTVDLVKKLSNEQFDTIDKLLSSYTLDDAIKIVSKIDPVKLKYRVEIKERSNFLDDHMSADEFIESANSSSLDALAKAVEMGKKGINATKSLELVKKSNSKDVSCVMKLGIQYPKESLALCEKYNKNELCGAKNKMITALLNRNEEIVLPSDLITKLESSNAFNEKHVVIIEKALTLEPFSADIVLAKFSSKNLSDKDLKEFFRTVDSGVLGVHDAAEVLSSVPGVEDLGEDYDMAMVEIPKHVVNNCAAPYVTSQLIEAKEKAIEKCHSSNKTENKIYICSAKILEVTHTERVCTMSYYVHKQQLYIADSKKESVSCQDADLKNTIKNITDNSKKSDSEMNINNDSRQKSKEVEIQHSSDRIPATKATQK